jgi:hypothetical protein
MSSGDRSVAEAYASPGISDARKDAEEFAPFAPLWQASLAKYGEPAIAHSCAALRVRGSCA